VSRFFFFFLSDNGGEFICKKTEELFQSLGISYVHGKPRTPREQGKVEKFNGTLGEKKENGLTSFLNSCGHIGSCHYQILQNLLMSFSSEDHLYIIFYFYLNNICVCWYYYNISSDTTTSSIGRWKTRGARDRNVTSNTYAGTIGTNTRDASNWSTECKIDLKRGLQSLKLMIES